MIEALGFRGTGGKVPFIFVIYVQLLSSIWYDNSLYINEYRARNVPNSLARFSPLSRHSVSSKKNTNKANATLSFTSLF